MLALTGVVLLLFSSLPVAHHNHQEVSNTYALFLDKLFSSFLLCFPPPNSQVVSSSRSVSEAMSSAKQYFLDWSPSFVTYIILDITYITYTTTHTFILSSSRWCMMYTQYEIWKHQNIPCEHECNKGQASTLSQSYTDRQFTSSPDHREKILPAAVRGTAEVVLDLLKMK